MRRSLAPSQQLHSLATKKPKFSSRAGDAEKENEDFVNIVDSTNTLKETLKSIRKSNVSSNDGKPNADEASETTASSSGGQSNNDALHSMHVRNELKDIPVDTTENTSTFQRPKFVPPKRFVSPLMTGQTKDTLNNTSHSGDVSGDTDNSIASRYYSVVW